MSNRYSLAFVFEASKRSHQRLGVSVAAGFVSTILLMALGGCSSGALTEALLDDNGSTTGNTENTEIVGTDTAYDPSDVDVIAETDYEGWHIAVLNDGAAALLDDETIFTVTFQLTNNSGVDGSASAASLLQVGDNFLALNILQDGSECDSTYVSVFNSDWELYDRVLLQLEENYLTISDGETVNIPIFYVVDGDVGEVTIEIVDDSYEGVGLILSTLCTFGD